MALGAGGVAFGYEILLPRAIHFLTNYDTQHYRNLIQASPYYTFVVTILVGIIVVFQTPLAVLGLVATGVLSSRMLRKQRRRRLCHHGRDRARASRTGSRDDVLRAVADVGALREFDLARVSLRTATAKAQFKLGYPGRLMARAAVRAKQAERAKAEAAKPRGKRKHASGGNPNQNLFFTRLRRRQRWVFLMLAVLFAISFAALGVGSGTGGLEQVFNGILGSGSDAVSQAQNEIKTDPKKGYLDLANAYQTNSDYTDAITALQNYLKIDKTNAAEWSQLGLIQARQASRS